MASKSESKRPSKETSKKDASSALGEQPPAIVDPDLVILHQVPGVVYDHVIDHQILTETFKKEDSALKRLSDLQKSSVQVNPQHLAYKPNPYNKSKQKFVKLSIFLILTIFPTFWRFLTLFVQLLLYKKSLNSQFLKNEKKNRESLFTLPLKSPVVKSKKIVKLCLHSSYDVFFILTIFFSKLFHLFLFWVNSGNSFWRFFYIFRKSPICDWKSLNRWKSRRSRRSK